MAELQLIFGLACFTGCAAWKGADAFTPGPHIYHRALYFAMIILNYSGARREEICGLSIDDVRWVDVEVDGKMRRIYYIVIAPNDTRMP